MPPSGETVEARKTHVTTHMELQRDALGCGIECWWSLVLGVDILRYSRVASLRLGQLKLLAISSSFFSWRKIMGAKLFPLKASG